MNASAVLTENSRRPENRGAILACRKIAKRFYAVVRFRRNLTAREFSQRIHAAARTRTWDNHVNSVVLYHLSYGGTHPVVVGTVS